MKLASVVISYDYSNEQIYGNVKKYLNDVDLMIIWDNTPQERKKLEKEFWIEKHPGIHVMSTGKNEGIGYALNRSIEYAQKEGCTHLLMMDQDSIWRNFKDYRNEIESDTDEGVALYAPTIADADSDIIYRCNKSDLYVITSGSVLALDFVQKIGLFNEKFFIDEVDNEYCIRIVQKGFHIKVYQNHFLLQHFGDGGKYSPFRLYHQVRNRIWMLKLYPTNLSWKYHARTIYQSIMLRLWSITTKEKNKKDKYKAIIRGLIHGIIKSPHEDESICNNSNISL